jgi:hypothetical protein
LNKRIGAAFIVMLFALGIVSVPVSAHFTLGVLTPTYDYHASDYDPHVAGVVGYVWPGVGYATSATGAGGLGAPQYPGYQSPYPGGNPGTKGTGYQGLGYTAGVGYYPPEWYQLDANNYAPFGAILANTIKPGTAFANTWWGNPTIEGLPIELAADGKANSRGDLVFAFNATLGFYANFTELFLWVPPEFKGISRSKVVTSWTNNYDGISVFRGDLDRNVYSKGDGSTDYWTSMYAPGWTCVNIHADRGYYYNKTQKDPALSSDIYYYPRCINFTDKAEWYYVALNDVVAPAISGRYFFKVGFRCPNMTVNTAWAIPQYEIDGSNYFQFMDIRNWPVLTVKGEIDPAIITGFIKFGGWNTTLYGQNVTLSGRVRAVGIADNPYTGVSLAKPVEARGYFNQTAKGHYEVEGVAPGTYDIYASCAGYPEMKIASGVKIQKGQSYHIDGYLTPGAVVHGTVFSKCGTGEVQWGAAQPMRIEIYSALKTSAADVEAVKPHVRFSPTETAYKQDLTVAYDSGSVTKTVKMPVTWSPWPDVTTLTEPTYVINQQWSGGAVTDPVGKYGTPSYGATTTIQFPWYFPKATAGYTEPGYDTAKSKIGQDPWGVGPAQSWLTASALTYFTWQFGDRGKYGAPCDWTGMVPEYNATWVGGLPAGQYYTRAWTLQYVQTQPDGVTFEHAPFVVASSEFPGDIDVPFDIRRGSIVKKTIHFHDVPGTLTELGVHGLPKSHFRPHVDAYHSTVKDAEIRARIYVRDASGFSWGYSGNIHTTDGPASYSVKGYDDKGYAGRSYGMPAGDYKIVDTVEGFVQDPAEFWISLGLCGTTIDVSNHVYRGVSFNVTIFAKDWEHPTVDQKWKYDNDVVYVGVYKDGKLLGVMWTWTMASYKPVVLNITNWFSDRALTGNYAWDTGLYEFRAFAYGYVQKKAVQVYATRGSMADILIKLCEGAQIPVTMKFKRESIYQDFNWNASMRVRVFDDSNKLVGEYLTSDPWHGYLNYDKATGITSQSPAFTVTTGYTKQTSPLNDKELNYVPKVTTTLQFTICGTPDLRYWFYDFSGDPVYNPMIAMDATAAAASRNDPTKTFNLGWPGYTDYEPTACNIAAPYGIDANPNYNGAYRLEVDVVPWYNWKSFFPMATGALYGESPKYIPENHLGPWVLNYPITVPGMHLGGEGSLYFELDMRGSTAGLVTGYTWCDDWRPTSWAGVTFTGADGKVVERVPTMDGRYFAYLPSGQLSMTIAEGGYVSPKVPVFVTDGGFGLRYVPLERANVPIPEFPVAAVVLAFSLAASLFILRRRRK